MTRKILATRNHPSNMITFIPYVNRFDLMSKAIVSIRNGQDEIFVINNSGKLLGFIPGVKIITPNVPLSFSQTMNFCIYIARQRGLPYFCVMHNDAESDRGVDKMSEMVDYLESTGETWGMILSNYDAFCCFNMRAIDNIGWWDTNLPQYFSDWDYYYRMRLAGYPQIQSEILCLHKVSGTIKHSERRRFLCDVTFPLYKQYYVTKWGGTGDKDTETFLTPFNNDLFNETYTQNNEALEERRGNI